MKTDKIKYQLLIAGDIMAAPHNMVQFEQGDVEYLFGEDLIQLFKTADYSIANLEGCLTTTDEYQLKSGPVIKATPKSVAALSNLGLKAVALANNHITDANQVGVTDTLKILEAENIDYVGVGPQKNMKSHIVIPFGEKSICLYNVSETFFNEPENEKIGANIYDEYLVCKDIELLKKTYTYVIVIFHAGSEYFRYPTPDVKRKCHRMVDSGADLITTQHTHCIGCEEYYNGAYILYGQGNFCFGLHRAKSRQLFTQQGILLSVEIGNDGLSIHKLMTSLIDNKYVRIDSDQNFAEFDRRSEELQSGKDFEDELTHCKYLEIAEKYIVFYKHAGSFFKNLRRFCPKLYKKAIMHYTQKELLGIYSTLAHSRRNEEMKLIFKYLIKQSN